MTNYELLLLDAEWWFGNYTKLEDTELTHLANLTKSWMNQPEYWTLLDSDSYSWFSLLIREAISE